MGIVPEVARYIRDLDAIDRDLTLVLTRREKNRVAISQLSGQIVTDTRELDRLLAERSAATTERLVTAMMTTRMRQGA